MRTLLNTALAVLLVTLSVASCGDDSDSGGSASGAGGSSGGRCSEAAAVIICQGATNCAFDPALIDCNVGCANLETICASGCASQPGCTDFTVDGCKTGCNFAKNQNCPNVTFGCEAQETTCAGLDACVAANL